MKTINNNNEEIKKDFNLNRDSHISTIKFCLQNKEVNATVADVMNVMLTNIVEYKSDIIDYIEEVVYEMATGHLTHQVICNANNDALARQKKSVFN